MDDHGVGRPTTAGLAAAWNSADSGFGWRIVPLGGSGGMCGSAGKRASATPSGDCGIVVSAPGGTRFGSLCVQARHWESKVWGLEVRSYFKMFQNTHFATLLCLVQDCTLTRRVEL